VTLPGVEVLTADTRAPRGPRLRLSTQFVIGETERGPTTPTELRGLRDLERFFGARTPDTLSVHDWLDAWWKDGGGRVYLARLVGPAAATADVDLADGAAAVALTVASADPGAFGNRLSVDVDATGGDFTLRVYLDDDLVETSPALADGAAAAAWALTSRYVRVTDGPGGDPVATGGPQDLTGGDDDLDGITTAEITAAGDRFAADLGPGVIVLPGRTAAVSQLAVAPTAKARNRIVRCDAPATSTVATITAWAATLRASEYADRLDLIAPRLTIPGLAPGTTRTAPGSYLRSAAEARNDAARISPNQPAAGRWGTSGYATGVTIEWDDDDRETLNDAGVNVIRAMDDEIKVYGNRTAADPSTAPAALRIGSARLRMAIAEIARFQGEQLNFGEIDQGGTVLGEHVGLVRSAINEFAPSLFYLDVTAEVIEADSQPGVFLVETGVEFQAAPDAERVRVTITRAVTEV
jgi:hypothetical protein